jgi:shikimate kinase
MSAPALGSIVLIGLRGTGKTTVGRLLAEKHSLPFYDADVVLEARAGKSIREIFDAEGEIYFRDLESEVLHDLLQKGPAVIAAGGGVVLRENNRQHLRAARKVIWLTADAETLWQRLQSDESTWGRRPDLIAGGRAEIEELVRQRECLYRDCANLVVNTAGRSPEEIVDEILAL